MNDDIRITSIDHPRLRAAIADLGTAPDPTEAWHGMAGALEDDDSTSDSPRSIAVGVIGSMALFGAVVVWGWLS